MMAWLTPVKMDSEDSCNDIPEQCEAQQVNATIGVGHGLTDTDAAITLARTLQLMRDQNGDGLVDHPEYDVWDAYEIIKK